MSYEIPETVACLGSSTTTAKGTFNWIDELARRPQNRRFRFVNFGVGGDLSVNIAKRLDPVLRVAPDRVIVLIGTNDILATVFPNFRRFIRAWKQISEEPSPAHFKDNLELITRRLQQETSAMIALSSLSPIGEALRPDDPVQSRLNELVAAYNGIIGDVSHSCDAHYIPFCERFRDQLDRLAVAKPFTRFSFAAFYRDYLFREMILRRSFDEISQRNGWEFHIDGIHLNTRGGRILTDVVQQFLDSPSR
ncbi:MAG: SGNH/GDSL hydrolase family protein [Mycobacterium sp.]|uniref:SGNH/GDSL hydrolase family protein n=1 Tax=Mycobacterium sp. TaxID=1785 RepID=UPI003C6929AE